MNILLLILSFNLHAQVGCMDNSHHLKEKFDNKELHYVACNCPCDTYAAYGKKAPYKDTCLECGHSHEQRPAYFVDSSSCKPSYKTPRPYTPMNHDIWINNLIHYKPQN